MSDSGHPSSIDNLLEEPNINLQKGRSNSQQNVQPQDGTKQHDTKRPSPSPRQQHQQQRKREQQLERQKEMRIRKIFMISLSFKFVLLIASACTLACMAESTPDVNIPACNYLYRPGFAGFLIVVVATFFLLLVFLVGYQLTHKLKETPQLPSGYSLGNTLKETRHVPQRMLDLGVFILVFIFLVISYVGHVIWFCGDLDNYNTQCKVCHLGDTHVDKTTCVNSMGCISVVNCKMFRSMRKTGIAALFWGAFLILLLILGIILLSCVIGKSLMHTPDGKSLFRMMEKLAKKSVTDTVIEVDDTDVKDKDKIKEKSEQPEKEKKRKISNSNEWNEVYACNSHGSF